MATQPTKINWIKAREDYVLDPTVSMADIADKYGVHLNTVKDKAKEQGWTELRQRVDQETAERLPEKAGETQAEYLARKFNEGKEISDLGRKVLMVKKTSIGTLVAKEMFVEGHRMQTEALGLDNPKMLLQQNNIVVSFADIVKKMRERVEKEQNAG